MAALTETVILTEDWDDVSQSNLAVFISRGAGVYAEFCVATSLVFADTVESGHVVSKDSDFMWEASAAGQNLYMRTTANPDSALDAAVPQIVVTLYP